MRVRACIAYHGKVHGACKSGLKQLAKCKDIDFDIEKRPTSIIAQGRNSLINENQSCLLYQKLTLGYDGYLVVDDDVKFNLDDVLKMISHNKDVCHAPYTLHNDKNVFDCGEFHPDFPGFIKSRYSVSETGFKTVGWAAAGMAYYKASVFENIEYPWYRHPIIRVKQSANTASEDIGLCLNLKAHGFKIWCDFDIRVKHMSRNKQPRLGLKWKK